MGLCFFIASVVLNVLFALGRATPLSDVSPVPRNALTRFASTNNPDINLRFVSDSGVCETTPGVHQMSGYIDVGTNMSMVREPVSCLYTLELTAFSKWFWFFESRESPETAPFTLWYMISHRYVTAAKVQLS